MSKVLCLGLCAFLVVPSVGCQSVRSSALKTGSSTSSGTDPLHLLPFPWLAQESERLVIVSQPSLEESLGVRFDGTEWQRATAGEATSAIFRYTATAESGPIRFFLLEPTDFQLPDGDEMLLALRRPAASFAIVAPGGGGTNPLYYVAQNQHTDRASHLEAFRAWEQQSQREQKIAWALALLRQETERQELDPFLVHSAYAELQTARFQQGETAYVQQAFELIASITGRFESNWLLEVSIFSEMERNDRVDWLRRLAAHPNVSELLRGSLEAIIEELEGEP